ncbi:MAG: IS30 family transposase [Patescibacteria group bacterium]|nr:IS30 family transposase [Patescibacteria group bacterium]
MHLSRTDRQDIAYHLKNGCSHRVIAEKAHHKSYATRKYSYIQIKKIALNMRLQNYIEEKLKLGWSPEKIAGRWNLDNPKEQFHFQRLYEWTQNNRPSLARYLLRASDVPRRRKTVAGKKQLIPNRIWIDERPVEANLRMKIGHVEGDTIVSHKGDKSVILTLVDRRSRYLIAEKLPNKKAQPMADLMKTIVNNFNIKTLTLDNGIEFQQYERIGCDTYFCHAYASWEKGTVENTNGLIRRYVPKKSRIKDLSHKRLREIVWGLNNTPRKCLGFLTPKEVHFALWNQST